MNQREVDLPPFLQIEPVGQCNLRCQMCSIPFRQDGPPHGPPAFMPFETFVKLLDQFPSTRELQLQGLGEPMMHPRFFDMVAHAAQKGLTVSTNTNLTLLNPQRAERCVSSGLDMLHVSLDAASAETYERIRVRAHFERVLSNLQLLLDARRRLGSARPGLRIVAVAMRQNLHELPELVRLAARFHIAEVFVQHLCHEYGESNLPPRYLPMRRFVQEQTLLDEDPARVAEHFAAAQATARVLGVQLRLPSTTPRPPGPDADGPRCDWPWRGAYVDFRGRALPCCMVSTADRIQLGNMVESGVRAVWNGAAYETFRAQLRTDAPPEPCRSCSIYKGTF
jgi:radical SAM protein with 4Fe4S-binding SPASM domain